MVGEVSRNRLRHLGQIGNPFDELRVIRFRPMGNGQYCGIEWIAGDSIFAKLGVQQNDIIHSLNTVSLRGMNLMDIIDLLRLMMDSEQIVTEVIRNGASILLVVDVKHDSEAEMPTVNAPHIFISGNYTFISEITEENENELIGYSASLRFRGPRHPFIRNSLFGGVCPYARFHAMREDGDADRVHVLWRWLYRELSDAANPERFKIPYAFAFNLTQEEHDLLEVYPDKILDNYPGEKANTDLGNSGNSMGR